MREDFRRALSLSSALVGRADMGIELGLFFLFLAAGLGASGLAHVQAKRDRDTQP